MVNELLADRNSLEDMRARRMRENPRTMVSLGAEEEVPYGKVSDVLQVLRRAEALRVNFATRKERR